MHPNGALPAYEWNFGDTNPPVHAWAALRVFEIDGTQDYDFLAEVFQKLLMNFTWWVNRVDAEGNNVFQGGFLGLDNVGPINRSQLPEGCALEQADGTAWMAFYCLSMLRIALRLAEHEAVYDAMALKFAEHFAAITDGMAASGMWDWQEGFFYDQLMRPDGTQRTAAGALASSGSSRSWPPPGSRPTRPCSATPGSTNGSPTSCAAAAWTRIDSGRAGFVYRSPEQHKLLLTVLDPERLRRVMLEVLSEDSFLSPHGLRSLSKRHQAAPFSREHRRRVVPRGLRARRVHHLHVRRQLQLARSRLVPDQPPGHRGPRALLHVPRATRSRSSAPQAAATWPTCAQVADELRRRLISIFVPDENGRRPVFGDTEQVPERPALELRAVLLRVLPRRQRRGAGGQPPDRVDRTGGRPDHRPAGLTLTAQRRHRGTSRRWRPPSPRQGWRRR